MVLQHSPRWRYTDYEPSEKPGTPHGELIAVSAAVGDIGARLRSMNKRPTENETNSNEERFEESVKSAESVLPLSVKRTNANRC